MKTLGDSIRALRQRERWTGEELAEKIGATKSQISKWENGVIIPSRQYIDALCEVFAVGEYELVCYKHPDNDVIECMTYFTRLSKSDRHEILSLMCKKVGE